MFDRPWRVYRILVPLAVVAFFIAGLGADKTPTDGGMYYVAVTGWIVFCIAFVAFLVFTAGVGVRRVRH
ncbi:MAG: hypothetical protein QOE35_1314 [Actinomycetota bacterium]|jgi:uncharacterized membrane protein YhaH (DUF805 family)